MLLFRPKYQATQFHKQAEDSLLTNVPGHLKNQYFPDLTEDRAYTVTGNHICHFSHPSMYKGQLKTDLYYKIINTNQH